MHWQWFINLFLMLTVSSFAQQTADTLANIKTKQILAYIAGLPQQGKVLSGQFAGYSPDTFNSSIMDQISQQIGQTPSILGCDWACGWDYETPPQNIIDYSCNPALKNHWSLGGLVTISMHLPNPASANGGGYNSKGNLNFPDLINITTTTGQRWQSFLDRMVQGLSDLQQSGVTVLFRPFHEMNGDWFFWGSQVKKDDYLKITTSFHLFDMI
jgi:mannan endo-1,4-beta-mannosidase